MGDNITSTYKRDAWQELSLRRRVDTDLEEEKWEVKSYFWVNISQRYFHFLVYGSNVHSSGVGAQWCLLSTEEQWAKFFSS